MIRYYRLMYNKNQKLYYPQVEFKRYYFNLFIFGKNYGPYKNVWRRIVQLEKGFLLFNDLFNGKTLEEANAIIKAYEEFASKDEPPVDCCYTNSLKLYSEAEKSRNKKPIYKMPLAAIGSGMSPLTENKPKA